MSNGAPASAPLGSQLLDRLFHHRHAARDLGTLVAKPVDCYRIINGERELVGHAGILAAGRAGAAG